ncbi:MAG TPA: class I SAM-dependent methyltransferase [Tepidisphaeraceae bacterium]|nr:class I SAM-dependent methyltransferase [Tepidisphaeraceae bacterium]
MKPWNSEIRSYGQTRGLLARLREASQLARKTRQSMQSIQAEVKRVIEQCQIAERITTAKTGVKLHGLKTLEIGVGQLPRQTIYFARNNDVTGIDLDVLPQGFDPAGYLHLASHSGTGRALKTLVRKLSGFDRRYNQVIARQLGLANPPPFKLQQMDACELEFPDNSFDFVYSFDVFEHLPDPPRVLAQVQRVLNPGGVLMAYIHLYTCDSGHHDLRVYLPGRGDLPHWAHLRPAMQNSVQTYVVLNRLRLGEWRTLFETELPGTSFDLITLETDQHVRDALPRLRTMGELKEFTDEELLTDRIIAVWKKP